ncbi:GMC family oxidoreductase N-terminal domain-containing protein [Marinobacter sp. M3C]|jgi:choline dehydrogenase|uniref:GMC family oxidoreductase n=1 Tax=unclassified Marinobacter TaxID=83889 RepID=UPI00200DF39B|nr:MULTISPECIES: GMC family oxidoreductase N-terminal domain-containing protein [unclassified Marinobacter]MCL1476223.1 GMC family oxidoreductase N-terminal domain-containing protein [Marinobacter sp.]MCL1482978.1 GMC family oxidoreductase N-terminal domain-containing protein [Marinobacter sp.]MCL1488792.1 GMC family oxidoreductase N-terminal domain-containing protein [Marinobacter sp.]UQG58125.1 GMC family oxidoreductase N-terminal domain-containing protein [Marinobacter sp. M4C]UQG60577.1 GM
MTKNKTRTDFDYIVVGSGAAGAIVASRLSENSDNNVCLLEAGQSDRHPFIHIPAGFIKTIFNPKLAWQFHTEGDEKTNDRSIPIPQGKTLGGSTAINGLVFNRGQQEDYDRWADLGNTDWDYESVLPYFKRIEKCEFSVDQRYRSQDGVVPISRVSWKNPVCEAFLKSAQERGIPLNEDYNGASQAGVGYFQRTISNGFRVSTASTYLKRARSRPNLHIQTRSQATRIILDGKKAVGVEFYNARKKKYESLFAKKEVIISAGAINTPKLLQLSGIGDPDLLKSLDIATQHPLPGVGKNLMDHYSVRVAYGVKNSSTINEEARGWRLGRQIVRWLLKRPSVLSLSPSLVHIFWKSDDTLDSPDLQGVFTPASYKKGYVGVLDDYPGMTCGFWQHKPQSRGVVKIRSKDPMVAPIVQPNYLSHPDDLEVLIKGIKLARSIVAASGLDHYRQEETFPGASVRSDEELRDFAREYGVSSYHLNGTAKMGPATDPDAVVDHQLKVHGIRGLRIVDSSIMPEITSSNICAPSMMIGEKGADMIMNGQ